MLHIPTLLATRTSPPHPLLSQNLYDLHPPRPPLSPPFRAQDEQCNALQLEAESLRNRLAAAEAAEGQLAGLREEVERMRAERDGRGAQVNSATRLLLDAAFEQSLREGWGSV